MLPEELKKGDRLTADWLNRLVREEVARTLRSGPGIRINQTPSGSTISNAWPPANGDGKGRVLNARVVALSPRNDGLYDGQDVFRDSQTEVCCLPTWASAGEFPSGTLAVVLEIVAPAAGGWS